MERVIHFPLSFHGKLSTPNGINPGPPEGRGLDGGHAAARLARRRLRQLKVGRRARRPLPAQVQAGPQPRPGFRSQRPGAKIRVRSFKVLHLADIAVDRGTCNEIKHSISIQCADLL